MHTEVQGCVTQLFGGCHSQMTFDYVCFNQSFHHFQHLLESALVSYKSFMYCLCVVLVRARHLWSQTSRVCHRSWRMTWSRPKTKSKESWWIVRPRCRRGRPSTRLWWDFSTPKTTTSVARYGITAVYFSCAVEPRTDDRNAHYMESQF